MKNADNDPRQWPYGTPVLVNMADAYVNERAEIRTLGRLHLEHLVRIKLDRHKNPITISKNFVTKGP